MDGFLVAPALVGGFVIQTIINLVHFKTTQPWLTKNKKMSEDSASFINGCILIIPLAVFMTISYVSGVSAVCDLDDGVSVAVISAIVIAVLYFLLYFVFFFTSNYIAAYIWDFIDKCNGKVDRSNEPVDDKKLEIDLQSFISNPANKAAVDEEIGRALSEMKYQKWDLSNVGWERKIAILLVNRGRIPNSIALMGDDTLTDVILKNEPVYHRSYISGKVFKGAADYDDIMEQYGFMLWIEETLRKQGIIKPIVVTRFQSSSRLDYIFFYSEAWNKYMKERNIARKYGQEVMTDVFLKDYTPKRADPPEPSIPNPYYGEVLSKPKTSELSYGDSSSKPDLPKPYYK